MLSLKRFVYYISHSKDSYEPISYIIMESQPRVLLNVAQVIGWYKISALNRLVVAVGTIQDLNSYPPESIQAETFCGGGAFVESFVKQVSDTNVHPVLQNDVIVIVWCCMSLGHGLCYVVTLLCFVMVVLVITLKKIQLSDSLRWVPVCCQVRNTFIHIAEPQVGSECLGAGKMAWGFRMGTLWVTG